MKILFDPSFNYGSWPGPLLGKEAVAGETWAGPRRLLEILETALGLGGKSTPQAVRAASLIPAIRQQEGFWSRSAEVEPFRRIFPRCCR